MRARLADAVRRELSLRKQRAGVMTYDDLLTRLDAILAGPGGSEVIRRLRARFAVVLVDEFQDTDPVQWNIVRRAFGDAGALVLIGDPKQAIYAFRGADVFAYLEAAHAAGTRATLGTNRRSDQALIDAYDALFGGARLGHDAIVYRRVKATAEHQAPRLAGAGAALRIRQVHRDEPDIVTTQHGYARNQSARDHIAIDLAADLVRLLSSDARIAGRRVEPGDVAVLVGRNRSAAQVRDALEAVDVPAVINGAGSVFGTAPAVEWLRLLEALERPASSPRARAAALTPFLGWTAERVATAAEPEWEAVHRRLHDWARVLRLRGVASLGEAIALAEGLPERVLATVEGERHLTDLRHVAQLLHQAATAEGLGTTALAAWLRRRIAEAGQDTSDEDRSRRLESDAAAVQVLTIHRSKGLEFPIVYLPFLWEPSFIPKAEPVAFHDPAARRPAHDRRRARGPGVRRAQGAGAGRAARGGPAARVRRADPRPPPGRAVVGAVVRQPPLGARAPAVRARAGRLGAAGRARHAGGRRRPRRASPRWPRRRPAASRSSARRSACRSAGAARRAPRRGSRRRASSARSTPGGAARRSPTSRAPRTRRASRASPRSRR